MAPNSIRFLWCACTNGDTGCNVMTPTTMSCDDFVKNKHDMFRFTPFRRGKTLRKKINRKRYSFGVS